MRRAARDGAVAVAVSIAAVSIAAVASVAGCSHRDEGPLDCSVVSTGVKQYWADRAKQTDDPDELAAIADTSRLASEKFEQHCVADHWNQDMIACARAVFRIDDSGCLKYLSTLQKARWKAGNATEIPGGIGIGP